MKTYVFMTVSGRMLLRMISASEKKVVEKIDTHVLCSVMFSENYAVCEMMWKNVVEPERTRRTA